MCLPARESCRVAMALDHLESWELIVTSASCSASALTSQDTGESLFTDFCLNTADFCLLLSAGCRTPALPCARPG